MFYYVILFLPPKDKYTFNFKMGKFWKMSIQYMEIHFKNIRTWTHIYSASVFHTDPQKTHFLLLRTVSYLTLVIPDTQKR